MELRNTQNFNIYLYKYQTKTATFLATNHEKTIMACSYLNFYKYFLHFEFLPRNTIKNESIHLNSWYHSHKKQKDSLETRVVLLIFSLELEILNIWGSRKDNTSKQRKMVAFVRNCLVKMTLRLF